MALARIGTREAVERVVGDIEKNRSGAQEVLATMAEVSSPQTFQVLQNTKLPMLASLPVGDYLAQASSATMLPIRVSQGVLLEDKARIVMGRENETALSALRNGVDTLNYTGAGYSAFLDKDAVYILPLREAFTKWREWLKTAPPES